MKYPRSKSRVSKSSNQHAQILFFTPSRVALISKPWGLFAFHFWWSLGLCLTVWSLQCWAYQRQMLAYAESCTEVLSSGAWLQALCFPVVCPHRCEYISNVLICQCWLNGEIKFGCDFFFCQQNYNYHRQNVLWVLFCSCPVWFQILQSLAQCLRELKEITDWHKEWTLRFRGCDSSTDTDLELIIR